MRFAAVAPPHSQLQISGLGSPEARQCEIAYDG